MYEVNMASELLKLGETKAEIRNDRIIDGLGHAFTELGRQLTTIVGKTDKIKNKVEKMHKGIPSKDKDDKEIPLSHLFPQATSHISMQI
jgi:hypothetical protein